ncbi:hypothetical protein STCU_07480 [Strigomonas culicis]|uniref:Uncharacterized protein n=1 Tax=Strigomonas culicis TaxID=28005 RepID=S9VKM5_9TRYP|nr:hypothetical protein STCU_07480 [Strigomonas culicis]|eukprot:EPY23760.1 hypothetical protein STCU_07480 [Strigomonas culicis]
MSTLIQLKEQLSEKELRVYELELEVKELRNEVTSLYDAKDKLDIANRNARVLEEENNNLHDLVKKTEGDQRYYESFPQGREALEVINENDDLRKQLDATKEELKVLTEKMRSCESACDKRIRDLCAERDRFSMESERNAKELESYRRQCIDLRRALENEQDMSKASAALWSQEKERYEQKITEVIANENFHAKEPRMQTRGEVPLQQALLQEEVGELESRLHYLQEKQWQKEKEWIQTENALRQTINELNRSETVGGNDKEVYKGLQDQVISLKNEIESLRGEKRANHAFDFVSDDIESVNPTIEVERIEKSAVSGMWSNKKHVDELLADNARLRDIIDELQNKNLSLQLQNDEKVIQNKDLEVLLVAEKQKQTSEQHTGAGSRVLKENSFSQGSSTGANDEVSQLKQRIRVLQDYVNDTKASQDQKDALTGARIKEYQRQIEELLNENKDIRSNVMETVLTDGSVVRLSKDKRDSVEDIMRLLEAAWQSEDETKRLLKKAQFQGAALANANAMKDEEVHRIQKALDDLEDRLRECYGTLDPLKHRLDDKDNVIHNLESRLRNLQADVDNVVSDRDALQRENRSLEKENIILRRQCADLDHSRGFDGNKLAEMNGLLDDLRDENSHLHRQLAVPKAPRWSDPVPSEDPSQSFYRVQ